MNRYIDKQEILDELISQTEKKLQQPKRTTRNSFQSNNFLHVAQLYGQLGFHLDDVANELNLSSDNLRLEGDKLRLEVLRLFNKHYLNDDETILATLENDLVVRYFIEINEYASQANQIIDGRQIAYTYILSVLTEIYLFLDNEKSFMNYITTSNGALGIIIANFRHIPYEQLSAHYKKIGSKGGNSKGKIREPIKLKILEHHDKHFTKKKDNGKFLYSNAKTARLIIKDLSIVEYAENTLANIIGKHRKHHFTD